VPPEDFAVSGALHERRQHVAKGKVIAGMTMSLDGFVADAEGNVDRLYADLADLQGTPYMTATIAETGAVLMGRKTFEMGDPDSFVGTYEFQVPIFVLTHHPPRIPPKQDDRLTFTFVQDGVASAVAQAKAAAGDKAVQVVGGANVIQQLLQVQAGLVDELHIDVMPVFLGDGLRLFEHAALNRIDLETIGVETVGQRTGLRFRVVR
jgi:dihydrofolate reductase